MDEQVKTLVDAVLAEDEVAKAVEIYLTAPKAVRRGAYTQIRSQNAALGKKIRTEAEKRRGIAFRTAEGVPVFTREEHTEQVLRLINKQRLMDKRKASLAERVVELKKQGQEIYGDDYLAELEAAIEQA